MRSRVRAAAPRGVAGRQTMVQTAVAESEQSRRRRYFIETIYAAISKVMDSLYERAYTYY